MKRTYKIREITATSHGYGDKEIKLIKLCLDSEDSNILDCVFIYVPYTQDYKIGGTITCEYSGILNPEPTFTAPLPGSNSLDELCKFKPSGSIERII